MNEHSAGSSVRVVRRDIALEWLAAQPLLMPAIGMMLGIVLDGCRHWPVGVHLAVFALAGLVLLVPGRGDGRRALAMALAAMSVGAILHDTQFRRWPGDHIVRYCGRESIGVRLTGTAVTAPLIRPTNTGLVDWLGQPPRSRFDVEAEKLQGVDRDLAVSGTVTVSVREPVLEVSPGDRVELFGTMYRPGGPSNPGELDFALVNQRRGALVEMSCDNAACVRVVAPGRGASTWWSAVRRRLKAAMLDHAYRGTEPGAQLLSAMVLGQRSAVSRQVNDAFIATGTVHYLSVSGAHIAMLASVVWLIGMLAGLTRRACAILTMVIVTGYAALAEPSAPVWRSAITGDLLCLSILLRRPTRSLNWLALAVIILLAIQPTQLFDPGFQLSFGTVVAILYLYPRVRHLAFRCWNVLLRRNDPLLMPAIQDMLNPPTRLWRTARSAGRLVCDAILVSVAAWLGSALPTAFHFQRLALLGWLDTVVALPLIWLTQMTGFLKPIVSLAVPPAGSWIGWPLARVSDALIAAVAGLARIPGSNITTPAVPGWLVVAGSAVLLLWAVSERLQLPRHVTVLSVLAVALVGAWSLAPPAPCGTLRLRVLAVGNGAAQVITLPDGRTLICDLGSGPLYDVVQWTLGPMLARDRVRQVDAVVVSHPNLDHYSAIPDLAERRMLGQMIVTPYFVEAGRTGGGASRLLARTNEQGVPLRTVVRGDRLRGTGEAAVEVLWPPASGWGSLTDPNDASIVLRLSYAGKRMLICGDIGPAAQQELMGSTDLAADVLVLPHHGKVSPTTPAFLRAVNPRVCIRSSGRRDAGNPDGIQGLMAGRQYLNTAEVGAVRIDVSAAQLHAYQGPDELPVVVMPGD